MADSSDMKRVVLEALLDLMKTEKVALTCNHERMIGIEINDDYRTTTHIESYVNDVELSAFIQKFTNNSENNQNYEQLARCLKKLLKLFKDHDLALLSNVDNFVGIEIDGKHDDAIWVECYVDSNQLTEYIESHFC